MPSRTIQEVEAENRLLRKEHRRLRWRLEQAIRFMQDGMERAGEFPEVGDATPPTR